MAKTLEVKMEFGYVPFSYYGASARQVEQVLEQIQDDLSAAAGNYVWRLAGDTYSGYKIVAHYEHNGKHSTFVDATGTSPAKTLLNFAPAKGILAEKYDTHPPKYKSKS